VRTPLAFIAETWQEARFFKTKLSIFGNLSILAKEGLQLDIAKRSPNLRRKYN